MCNILLYATEMLIHMILTSICDSHKPHHDGIKPYFHCLIIELADQIIIIVCKYSQITTEFHLQLDMYQLVFIRYIHIIRV